MAGEAVTNGRCGLRDGAAAPAQGGPATAGSVGQQLLQLDLKGQHSPVPGMRGQQHSPVPTMVGQQQQHSSMPWMGQQHTPSLRIGQDQYSGLLLGMGLQPCPVLGMGGQHSPVLPIGGQHSPVLGMGQLHSPSFRMGQEQKSSLLLGMGLQHTPVQGIAQGLQVSPTFMPGLREQTSPVLGAGKRQQCGPMFGSSQGQCGAMFVTAPAQHCDPRFGTSQGQRGNRGHELGVEMLGDVVGGLVQGSQTSPVPYVNVAQQIGHAQGQAVGQQRVDAVLEPDRKSQVGSAVGLPSGQHTVLAVGFGIGQHASSVDDQVPGHQATSALLAGPREQPIPMFEQGLGPPCGPVIGPGLGPEQLLHGQPGLQHRRASPEPGTVGAVHGRRTLPRKASIIKDASRQKQPEQKKTVSFSSMPTEKKISSAGDCVSLMQEGSELKKVRSNSRIYQRFFLLESDLQHLRWEPSKKDLDKARLEVRSIKEVRAGKNTDIFRSNGISEQVSEDCAFSIIYGESYESLDLVANSADVASAWVTGLRYLLSCSGRQDISASIHFGQSSLRRCWLQAEFKCTVTDDTGYLSEAATVELIHKLHPGLRNTYVKLKLKEVLKNNDRPDDINGLTVENFIDIFNVLATRPEVYFLLVQFSSNKEYLDFKDLALFLDTEQGMAQVSEEVSLDIIRRYEPSQEGRTAGCLGIDGFTRYLMSPECHVFDPDHRHVCQDMTQPLSHYYIHASHNTYLVEDQFRGPSDIGGFIRALRLGCRSVELDVWDGPEKEPLVFNGHTMTSPITLRAALDAIGKHAFAVSEFPLLLCLEVHCCPAQQRTMVHHMKEVLKEKLYTEPVDTSCTHLPSPESLRGRILIKGPKLPPGYHESEGDVSEEDEAAQIVQHQQHGEPEAARRLTLTRELSDLASLCQSVRFRDFDVALQSHKYWEISSFSELQASRLISERSEDFLSYNKRFLSRVYPSPMRLDSSNMNPLDFWKCGCQLVGLNLQTPGLMLDLNVGWFQQNGGCGYVLRPAIMREAVSYFRANTHESFPGLCPQTLHLRIISGQNLPKPKGSGAKGEVLDPYVAAEIHGIPADCAEQRTKTVYHDGDHPIFEESFEFQLHLPELALLRLVVLDDDYIGDEFIGQYTIPLECLQPGYRHVPLLSLTGELLTHASIFIHVAVTNRRGGGKSQKRGLSVMRGRRTRKYVTMRTVGIKAVDEVFRAATQPLRDGADLRENSQAAVLAFKEVCGLPPVANLAQCMLVLCSRLLHTDGAPHVGLVLRGPVPCLEVQGVLPDVLKKGLGLYDAMMQELRTLLENTEAIHSKITQCQKSGLELHEDLGILGNREGLKGRKLAKAIESFTWNITLLKGQADLLWQAKGECIENIRQVHSAAISCGLNKTVGVAAVSEVGTTKKEERQLTGRQQVQEDLTLSTPVPHHQVTPVTITTGTITAEAAASTHAFNKPLLCSPSFSRDDRVHLKVDRASSEIGKTYTGVSVSSPSRPESGALHQLQENPYLNSMVLVSFNDGFSTEPSIAQQAVAVDSLGKINNSICIGSFLTQSPVEHGCSDERASLADGGSSETSRQIHCPSVLGSFPDRVLYDSLEVNREITEKLNLDHL